MNRFRIIPLLLLTLLLCAGCGTRRNTPLSRQWQAFTTRYNVFHNGDEHFREQLSEMEKNYADDYSRMLPVHPAEARGDERLPQPEGDFRRTVEKMQKAIELHSITRKPQKRSRNQADRDFRAREEFNPFLHNAWMRMGEALYYDGDFMTAATTFLYISRHFQWLPDIVTEARLRQAASYCALGWTHEAENVLRLVRPKSITTPRLRLLHNLVEADLRIHRGEWSEAVEPLKNAAAEESGMQRHRLLFLLGQVYSRIGEKQKAFDAFGKAASGISVPHALKVAARIRQSEVYAGNDINSEVKALTRMTRYERNREYLDLIHYAIGNLRMAQGDTAQAEKNYILAIAGSTREGTDAALARLALGNLYFARGEYAKAQPLLSEAAARLPEDYPGIREISGKSAVLDELAIYSENVHLQDSLLVLASLSPEKREEECRRLADDYRRKMKELKEEEERTNALENARALPVAGNLPANTPATFTSNADNSWYFYNPAMVSAGKAEFQKKWGARKLEDNWRRRDKSTFSTEETDNGEDDEGEEEENADAEDKENTAAASDPANPEYYLAAIPSSPAEIASSNRIIEEGLYNMGLILKDRLDNYPAARRAFSQLDHRYPDNPFRLDAFHAMYLMAVRDGEREEAEKWRQRILSDFPDSPYATALSDPDYFSRLRDMSRIQSELYEQAYSAYLDNRNGEVRQIASEMRRLYPLSPMMPKFLFLDALASLTEGDPEAFRSELTDIVRRWPESDVAEAAGGMLRRLKEGGVPQGGSSNPRGMVWQTKLGEASEADGETPDSVSSFRLDPASPQYLVLVFSRNDVNSNQVIYDIARFNFTTFSVKDFDLEVMGFDNVGLVVVKGFADMRELSRYMAVLGKHPDALPPGVEPVMISKENFEILLRESRSFEDYFRFRDEAEAEKIEKIVEGN